MPGVVHQTRIVFPPFNFGYGHTSNVGTFGVAGTTIGMGGWKMATGADSYIGCSFPPIGKQDPSSYYPGRPVDMDMVSIEVFYLADDAGGGGVSDSTNLIDFEYGLQGKAVTEAILTTRPENFTDTPNGTLYGLERVTDTLSASIPLDTDDWGGVIFARRGATGSNELINPNTSNIFIVGFVINLG